MISAHKPGPLPSWRRTVRSFRFAVAGMAYLVRTQPNARVHVAATCVAAGLAAWLGLSAMAWAILALAATLVIALEAVNTSLEALVDLASPGYHDLARTAKDTAAAAVLIGAVGAVAVGLCVLGPPLWGRIAGG